MRRIKNFIAKCAYCDREVKFTSIRQLLSYGWLAVMNMYSKRGFTCWREECLTKDGRTAEFIAEHNAKHRKITLRKE